MEISIKVQRIRLLWIHIFGANNNQKPNWKSKDLEEIEGLHCYEILTVLSFLVFADFQAKKRKLLLNLCANCRESSYAPINTKFIN